MLCDSFSGDAPASVWNTESAAGVLVRLGVSATDARLEVLTPDRDRGASWDREGNRSGIFDATVNSLESTCVHLPMCEPPLPLDGPNRLTGNGRALRPPVRTGGVERAR
jgi:hypothetical protein